ncbi:MAG TPA: GxxExxY protein [Longimicrobiales bacterium]|nr:GxxExxY protein [Longimicrobiales bacterium]
MRATDPITGEIIDSAVKLHKRLGPGLLESVYEALLARDLERRGLRVERQKRVRFEFDGLVFDEGLRVDLLVEDIVVVELKSADQFAPVHWRQLLTYLRLLHLPVGLLINFGAPTLKDGLRRVLNDFHPSVPSVSPCDTFPFSRPGEEPAPTTSASRTTGRTTRGSAR